jgi:hypothetical protein
LNELTSGWLVSWRISYLPFVYFSMFMFSLFLHGGPVVVRFERRAGTFFPRTQ